MEGVIELYIQPYARLKIYIALASHRKMAWKVYSTCLHHVRHKIMDEFHINNGMDLWSWYITMIAVEALCTCQ